MSLRTDSRVGSAARTFVQVTSDPALFRSLAPAWNELWEVSEAGMMTTSHAFLRSWWDTYGAGKHFLALLVWEGDVLVAALMLLRKRRGAGPLQLRILRGFGPWHSGGRNGILHRPGRVDAVQAILETLEDLPGWDVAILGRLEEQWEQTGVLRRARLPSTLIPHPALAQIELHGSYATFLAARSGRFRAELRRRDRRRQEHGGFRIEVRRGGEVDAEAFERMAAIDRDSWKGESIVGVAAPERLAFFRRFLGAAAELGWPRLYFLQHHGRDAAFAMMIDAGSTTVGFKMSYRPEYAAFSPGGLLQQRAIEDSFESGLKRLDFFSPPTNAFHRAWHDTLATQVEVELYRRTAPGLGLWLARRARPPRNREPVVESGDTE